MRGDKAKSRVIGAVGPLEIVETSGQIAAEAAPRVCRKINSRKTRFKTIIEIFGQEAEGKNCSRSLTW